jgi:hypothetical protein
MVGRDGGSRVLELARRVHRFRVVEMVVRVVVTSFFPFPQPLSHLLVPSFTRNVGQSVDLGGDVAVWVVWMWTKLSRSETTDTVIFSFNIRQNKKLLFQSHRR